MTAVNAIFSGSTARLFWPKPALALALAMLADFLFFGERVGSISGLFALVLFFIICVLKAGRLPISQLALYGSVPFILCLSLLYNPSWLNISLFWLTSAHFALHGTLSSAPNAFFSLGRILDLACFSPVNLGRASHRSMRALRPQRQVRGRTFLRVMVVPLLLGVAFLFLFASANPVIEEALSKIDLALLFRNLSFARILFLAVALCLIWPLIRPRLSMRHRRKGSDERIDFASLDEYFTATSIFLSLIFFNLLFLVQNLTDLVFLWSEASLPYGMTYASYAHRGAYPLIVTALLAAAYVLLVTRPDSSVSKHRGIRALVILWVIQNIALVFSSINRTLIYIDTYALTLLRLSALLWMGLVALGLALIIWRFVKNLSSAWLINSNVAAALTVLISCTFLDLQGFTARFNVRQGYEASSVSKDLDLDYLESLGPPAIPAMDWLLSRNLAWQEVEAISRVRMRSSTALKASQDDWRGWTLKNALIAKNLD